MKRKLQWEYRKRARMKSVEDGVDGVWKDENSSIVASGLIIVSYSFLRGRVPSYLLAPFVHSCRVLVHLNHNIQHLQIMRNIAWLALCEKSVLFDGSICVNTRFASQYASIFPIANNLAFRLPHLFTPFRPECKFKSLPTSLPSCMKIKLKISAWPSFGSIISGKWGTSKIMSVYGTR